MKNVEHEQRPPRLITATYQRALRLLPGDVRRAYAEGMSDTFQRRAEEVWKTKGALQRLWFVVRELTGLLRAE